MKPAIFGITWVAAAATAVAEAHSIDLPQLAAVTTVMTGVVLVLNSWMRVSITNHISQVQKQLEEKIDGRFMTREVLLERFQTLWRRIEALEGKHGNRKDE